jgi:hypothetical protein
MSKFIKTNIVEVVLSKDNTIKIDIVRFIKEPTKRVFFTPEISGKRIVSTMFARKYSAVNVAKQYIKYKQNKT